MTPRFPRRNVVFRTPEQKRQDILNAVENDYHDREDAREAQILARQGLTRHEAELGAATVRYFEANEALDGHLLDLADVLGLTDYNEVPDLGYEADDYDGA
jgi:hypothetical protein